MDIFPKRPFIYAKVTKALQLTDIDVVDQKIILSDDGTQAKFKQMLISVSIANKLWVDGQTRIRITSGDSPLCKQFYFFAISIGFVCEIRN